MNEELAARLIPVININTDESKLFAKATTIQLFVREISSLPTTFVICYIKRRASWRHKILIGCIYANGDVLSITHQDLCIAFRDALDQPWRLMILTTLFEQSCSSSPVSDRILTKVRYGIFLNYLMTSA